MSKPTPALLSERDREEIFTRADQLLFKEG